ncbi:MAG: twin transmembrane helix small protein [Kangiellaceae bacterium]|nr:twin transmembrane helix small protein [Kangiellaceae bacterium]
MLIKIVLIILMVAILFSLFRGLFFLGKGGEENSKKLVKSLSWRIGLSILLFVLIILLNHFGVIQLRDNILPIETQQQVPEDQSEPINN